MVVMNDEQERKSDHFAKNWIVGRKSEEANKKRERERGLEAECWI